jgi:hypothetical protein
MCRTVHPFISYPAVLQAGLRQVQSAGERGTDSGEDEESRRVLNIVTSYLLLTRNTYSNEYLAAYQILKRLLPQVDDVVVKLSQRSPQSIACLGNKVYLLLTL